MAMHLLDWETVHDLLAITHRSIEKLDAQLAELEPAVDAGDYNAILAYRGIRLRRQAKMDFHDRLTQRLYDLEDEVEDEYGWDGYDYVV